ncbi:DUF3310 domain-containing protein [Streptococcus sp. 400_SSPC]|uniref:DUF3310 domain-containing protein n=1 Tax=Streptococcus sp. 400_SSPC TaxID=1579341 RepID=UPI0009E26B83|nr:DUF3310 domain-containing protein [Streptococcus sp. 400_SSPC]
MSDNVHNPKHYQGRNGLEAIDVHRNFMNDEQLTGYHLGNLLKYLLRYRKKNGIEDLEKAKVHMDWLIEKEKAMMLQQQALTKENATLDALAKACTLIGGKSDQ